MKNYTKEWLVSARMLDWRKR